METKLSTAKQKELVFLNDLTLLITNYFIEIGETDLKVILEDIDTAFKNGWITGFREGLNDLVLEALELPTDQLTELNRRLKERFGKDLFDMNQKLEKRIQAIIKRKKVRNDEESRMIAVFLDTIRDVEGREQEVEILEELNFAYEGL